MRPARLLVVLLFGLLGGVLWGACGRADPAAIATVGLDPTALDFTAQPCGDFYRFACGGFLSRTVLPRGTHVIDLSITPISRSNQAHLEEIIDRASGRPDDPLGVFYRACMDDAALDRAGVTPLAELLAVIDQVTDGPTLAVALAALHRASVGTAFSISAGRDLDDPARFMITLEPGGLDLHPTILLDDQDAYAVEYRARFRAHAQALFTLAGVSQPGAAAVQAVDFERALAARWPQLQREGDPLALHGVVSRDQLVTLAPGLAWTEYFAAVGLSGVTRFDVVGRDYVSLVAWLAAESAPSVWRSYLRLRLLRRMAPALGPRFLAEYYAFDEETVPERRAYCVRYADAWMWQLVGREFVERALPGRPEAVSLIERMARTFDANLARLPWLDEPTREEARSKLAQIEKLVGGPDTWPELAFTPDPESFTRTILHASRAYVNADLRRAGNTIDRREWLTGTTVEANAFYLPDWNQVVIPAGILQRPFFDPEGSLAVNLGGIGAVMGHELTHGFDDSGSRYDGQGAFRDWWTAQSRGQFDERARCLIEQYGSYHPHFGYKIDGAGTLGENIADGGGIKLAIRALRTERAATGGRPGLGGFSEEQLLFIAYAQSWCAVTSSAYDKYLIRYDPHAPAKYRVNGPLRNLPEFTQAFGCQPGSELHPPYRCELW